MIRVRLVDDEKMQLSRRWAVRFSGQARFRRGGAQKLCAAQTGHFGAEAKRGYISITCPGAYCRSLCMTTRRIRLARATFTLRFFATRNNAGPFAGPFDITRLPPAAADPRRIEGKVTRTGPETRPQTQGPLIRSSTTTNKD